MTVVTTFPLGEVIQNCDATGRIVKWALELMGEGITYPPRTAVKSQVLVDFVAEWTKVQMPLAPTDQEYCMMYFDGSLMRKGTGVGLVFLSLHGVHMKYMVHLHFPASNNIAEYEALINSLRITIELDIRRLNIRVDSHLFIDQMMKDSSCHSPNMAAYCQEVRRLEDKFIGLELNHVPRRLNEAADALAKAMSSRDPVLTGMHVRQ